MKPRPENQTRKLREMNSVTEIKSLHANTRWRRGGEEVQNLASTEIECFSVETTDFPFKTLSSPLPSNPLELVIGSVISLTSSVSSLTICAFEIEVDVLEWTSCTWISAPDSTSTSFIEHSECSQHKSVNEIEGIQLTGRINSLGDGAERLIKTYRHTKLEFVSKPATSWSWKYGQIIKVTTNQPHT